MSNERHAVPREMPRNEGKRPTVSAADALDAALETACLDHVEGLAQALVAAGLKGQIQSLRLIIDLLARRRDAQAEAAETALPCMAELWALEPAWVSDPENPDAQERWDIFLPPPG